MSNQTRQHDNMEMERFDAPSQAEYNGSQEKKDSSWEVHGGLQEKNGSPQKKRGGFGENYNGPHMVGGELKTVGMSGSAIKDALLDISAVRGRDALLSPHTLEKELRKRGVSELETCRLCLLARVRGYAQLVDARTQYDVERFVWHALRETGLRRDIVLDLAGSIASLSGVQLRGTDGTSATGRRSAAPLDTPETLSDGRADSAAVFPIPVGFYQEELDAVREDFRKAAGMDVSPEVDVSPDTLARLRPLAAAGIPEARFLLGSYLLRRSAETVPTEADADPEEALNLLKGAAADGEPNAAAALADFYYQRREPGDWAEAFRCYTGFGSLALNDRRRIALVDILNQKITNRRLFRFTGAALAVLALLFLVPAAPLYGGGWAWCTLFLLTGGGVLGEGFRRFRKEPYGEYYAVPASVLAAWTACWLLRILL